MEWLWGLASAVHAVIVFAVIINILRRRDEPASMTAWILAVFALPILGITLYLLISPIRVRRRLTRRRKRVAHVIEQVDRLARRVGDAVERPLLAPDLAPIEQLGRRMVEFPAAAGNRVDVYEDANAIYACLEREIRAAQHHVHLQYYIWKPDETGTHFRDLVIEKARQGVQCRVLLDAVGCLALTHSFVRPMLDAGVRVAFFMPLFKLRRRWSPHLRNHRKIAVFDGVTALVGSQNIGDEYRGRLKRLSPWYDSHIRVAGPAATALQQIFAEDWAFATQEPLVAGAYFPTPTPQGDSIVQILPSGPDADVSVLGQILFSAIAAARESISIATPYFVPYPALRMALVNACFRGVKVELVVPSRSDNTLVLWAGRSYYAALMDAGVEVYEFDRGMLHSKMVAIDDRFCLVGSANMDVRSFRLNFEVTALIYDPKVTATVAALIRTHRQDAHAVSPKEVWNRPFHAQLAEGAARLCSPLL